MNIAKSFGSFGVAGPFGGHGHGHGGHMSNEMGILILVCLIGILLLCVGWSWLTQLLNDKCRRDNENARYTAMHNSYIANNMSIKRQSLVQKWSKPLE